MSSVCEYFYVLRCCCLHIQLGSNPTDCICEYVYMMIMCKDVHLIKKKFILLLANLEK